MIRIYSHQNSLIIMLVYWNICVESRNVLKRKDSTFYDSFVVFIFSGELWPHWRYFRHPIKSNSEHKMRGGNCIYTFNNSIIAQLSWVYTSALILFLWLEIQPFKNYNIQTQVKILIFTQTFCSAFCAIQWMSFKNLNLP